MAKKAIKPLTETPSKEEEIAFFNAITDSLPEASLLKRLFHEAFNCDVVVGIREGKPIDIWLKLMDSEKKCTDLQKERDMLTTEVLTRGREIKVETQKIADLNQHLSAEIELSQGRLQEMQALRKLLIAVVTGNGDEETKTTAAMLVRAWQEHES